MTQVSHLDLEQSLCDVNFQFFFIKKALVVTKEQKKYKTAFVVFTLKVQAVFFISINFPSALGCAAHLSLLLLVVGKAIQK